MDTAIGVDIGTSGVRAVAMNREGSIVGKAAASMPPPLRIDEHLRQDGGIWWSAVGDTLDALRSAIDFQRVRAIAVDGTSGTILAIKSDGDPLDLASMYNDIADEAGIGRVDAAAPRDTAARGASSPLARALAFQTIPGVDRIVHQADWIAGRLSGDFRNADENNALKTGYDPRTRQWPNWIDRCGLDRGLLPEVVPAGTQIGRLSTAASARFGLPSKTAIVAGTTDGCAAFLATGAHEVGAGVTSLGTTLTLKLLSDTPVFSPEFGIYSHRIGDQWLAGGASNTGGAVLLHYFDRERMNDLESKIVPARPTGLDYYPLIAPGERFPINDARLAPRVTPRPDDDARFFQALLEGIASVEALGYRKLREIGASPLRSIRTVGGGAQNRAWVEIRRRMLDVPFMNAASEDAAAGTARLAWRGLGVVVGQ